VITHPDGQAFTYGHDGLNRLSGVYEGPDTSVWLSTITYTAQALPQRRLDRYSSTATYGYDGVGRLASLADGFGNGVGDVTFGFGYNPAGQTTGATRDNDAYAWGGHYAVTRAYTTNGLNQYSAAGSASFTYDANGSLVSDGGNGYVYDIENRLVTASGAHSAVLAYDPLGRLWQVTSGTSTTRFIYDGDALVGEYDGSGTMTERYVHGSNAGADDPLLWYHGPSIAATIHWLHTDRLGSIIATVNNYGVQSSINTYDEYGIPGAANQGRFQYTGQAWLPELGMYYYKARIYSPTLGRFMQTDPIGYAGGINLYGYVSNDPVNRIDPLGTADLNLFGDQDDARLRDAGANFDVPGFFTVAAHGSPVISTIGGQRFQPSDFGLASMISARNFLHQPVLLLACRTGGDGAINSRNLARYMGVPVIAPTNQTWWGPRRGDWIDTRVFPKDASGRADRSHPGHFVLFTPDGRQIHSINGRQITGLSRNVRTGETIAVTIGTGTGTRIPEEQRFNIGTGQ
jgi:RHS repeat-associated protein